MENYSRDLLSGIGGGDEADRGEQQAQQRFGSQTEEVELSLGLSLGGRLGQERRSGEGSSSAAPIQEVAPAPPTPVRVNSVPTTADAEAANKESLGGTSRAEVQPSATVQGSGFPSNVTAVQPAAQLPASFSPAPGSSSSGEGILAGTSSLPAGIDDAWKKRKAAQALRRLEVKRRIERMNSSKVSVEEVGKNQDEMNAPAKEEKVENLSMKNEQTGGTPEVKISGDLSMKNEQTGGQPKVERMNHSNVRRRPSGLPPLYRPPVAKQGSSMPGKPKMQNSALNGAPSAQGRILSSAAVPSSGGTNGVLRAGSPNNNVMAVMAPAPSPALPVTAAAPSPALAVMAPAPSPASAVVAPAPSPALAVAAAGVASGGGQQAASERAAARATRGVVNVGRMGVMVPVEVLAMPWVWTWMLPNGGRIAQGILYNYSRADQVRILCWCHGRFLSPAEFVEHAGGGQVANPLRHIMVYRPAPARM